jgi:hypothetical protein
MASGHGGIRERLHGILIGHASVIPGGIHERRARTPSAVRIDADTPAGTPMRGPIVTALARIVLADSGHDLSSALFAFVDGAIPRQHLPPQLVGGRISDGADSIPALYVEITYPSGLSVTRAVR